MAEAIKTMKLYAGVERVFNELRELGIADSDPVQVEDLVKFDQYHYEGVEAVEQAIKTCNITATHQVLEVGSGIGGPSRYLAHTAGCHLTALELQADLNFVGSQLTERCNLSDQVRHLQGDILQGHPGGGDFDTLVSWLVFLHIPDRATLFTRCFEALKPGGMMFIEDFSKRGEFTSQETALLENKIYCHYVPTMQTYLEQVSGAGFVDIVAEDMTEPWTRFVRTRSDAFREAKTRHIRVNGEAVYYGLEEFYNAMTTLYEGGNLGGLRLVARKPG
ncbi:MAG: methyltransferase domain-containing protein [Chloroflexota bacterium]